MDHLKNLLIDLEKSVQCAICLQSLTNPVTTRCDHNFCNLCITKAFTGKYQIPCPLCKKIIKNRSLKKADHLRSLIPLVHQMTNHVQEEASIPYTLSQSTRQPIETSTLTKTNNYAIQEGNVIAGQSTVLNGDLSQNSDASVNPPAAVEHQQDITADKGVDSSGTKVSGPDTCENGEKNSTGEEEAKKDDSAANFDSFNIVAKVTVAAEIHSSPSTEVGKTAPKQHNVADKPRQEKEQSPEGNNFHPPDSFGTALPVTSTVADDPYEFPVSQKTAPAKQTLKKAGKKKGRAVALKKRKSSSECERSRPKRQKKSPRPVSDAEVQMAMAQKMIDEVEVHPLVVENITGTPLKGSKRKSQTRKKSNTKEKGGQKTGVLERSENPILTRRLLSDSSSGSSLSENDVTRNILPKTDGNQQSVKDKVQSWLQTASPSAVSDSGVGRTTTPPGKEKIDALSDDDISHSQVSIEHLPDRVIVLKRRKFSSPVKLDPKIQESVRNQLWSREVAVFGNQKPVKTYLPNMRRERKFVGINSKDVSSGEKQDKTKAKRRGKKVVVIGGVEKKKRDAVRETEPELENIFDIPGLSQGVSPFGTPEKSRKSIQDGSLQAVSPQLESNEQVGLKAVDGELVPEVCGQLNHDQEGLPSESGKMDDSVVVDISKPEETRSLNDVVNDLNSPTAENYEIQDQDTEDAIIASNNKAGAVEGSEKIQLNNPDKNNADFKEPSTISGQEPVVTDNLKSPVAKTQGRKEDGLETKKPIKSIPTRRLRSEKLPSLGESPTTSNSGKQTHRRKASLVQTTGVELGLLDFSEPMHVPSVSASSTGARTEVVAETCRMVMESLGKLSQVDKVPAESNNLEPSATKCSADAQPDDTPALDNSLPTTSAYATEDSVVPPSTSTANLELPETPQKCNLEQAPGDTIESTCDGSDNLNESIASTPSSPNRNIIKNAPLPGETEFSEVEKNVILDVAHPGYDIAVVDNSVHSDTENTGSLQCLTNGWGGTRLRIFRSTGSDTDSNASGFSEKKKVQKKKGSRKQDSFASNHLVGDKSIPLSGDKNAMQVDATPADGNINHAGKYLPDSSTDVIPDSEKTLGNIDETGNATPVRKSSRKNKGCHTSYDFVGRFGLRKRQKEASQVKEDYEDNADTNAVTNNNVVLQHLRNAMAEIEGWYDNRAGTEKTQEKGTPTEKSETKTGGKLTKVHPKKKCLTGQRTKLQTGKRTKKNTLTTDGAPQMMNLCDEFCSKLTSSWPQKGSEKQTSFVFSQPTDLPKHLTDVSVRMIKLDEISIRNFAPMSGEEEKQLDSSPMLFNMQDTQAGGQDRQEDSSNQRGRSISIDLSNPTEVKQTPAITEEDMNGNCDYIQEDTDDVICCSWNEEDRLEVVATSCHEDECSNASGQHLSQQSSPKKPHLGENKERLNSGSFRVLSARAGNPYLKEVIWRLKKVSNIDQHSIEKLIPESMISLQKAIDACIQACTAIETEMTEKSRKNSELGSTTTQKSPKLQDIAKTLGSTTVLSKITSKKSGRRPMGRRSHPRNASEMTRNSGAVEKRAPVKKDPSPGETPSTSGLNFHGKSQVVGSKTSEEREDNAEELQDFFNETDDMPLFVEQEMETDARIDGRSEDETASSQPRKTGASESSAANGVLIPGCGNEDELGKAEEEDVIAATQENGVDSGGIVASNVDSWLKRLSDLNKKKAEIHKKKIGGRWKSSPISPLHAVMDPELSKDPDALTVLQEADALSENLHGVTTVDTVNTKAGPKASDDLVVKPNGIISGSKDASEFKTKPESIGEKGALRTFSSPSSHGSVTPDQLPQVSVMVKRTPMRELQGFLSPWRKSDNADNQNTSQATGPTRDPGTSMNNGDASSDVEEPVKVYSGGIRDWLESRRTEPRSPSQEDSSPLQKMGIVTTGLQENDIKLVKIFANRYKGQYYPTFDNEKVTHVVVRSSPLRTCDRTLKYLQGISGRKWILDIRWVISCLRENKLLPENGFEIAGDNSMKELESEDCETPQVPKRSRMSDPNFKLLSGYRCVCLPPYSLITTEQTSELLRMCGATVVSHLGELIASDAMTADLNELCLIIVDPESSSELPDYSALGEQFGAAVINIEWVYESISRFEVQPLNDFLILGFTQDSESTHY